MADTNGQEPTTTDGPVAEIDPLIAALAGVVQIEDHLKVLDRQHAVWLSRQPRARTEVATTMADLRTVLGLLAGVLIGQVQAAKPEVDEVALAAARKIVRWGIDEARERDAMHEEASSIGIDRGLDDDEIDELATRIEAAIDGLVATLDAPAVSRG